MSGRGESPGDLRLLLLRLLAERGVAQDHGLTGLGGWREDPDALTSAERVLAQLLQARGLSDRGARDALAGRPPEGAVDGATFARLTGVEISSLSHDDAIARLAQLILSGLRRPAVAPSPVLASAALASLSALAVHQSRHAVVASLR